MTVNELIEQLQALPAEDRERQVVTHETGGTAVATEVMLWSREFYERDEDRAVIWIGS